MTPSHCFHYCLYRHCLLSLTALTDAERVLRGEKIVMSTPVLFITCFIHLEIVSLDAPLCCLIADKNNLVSVYLILLVRRIYPFNTVTIHKCLFASNAGIFNSEICRPAFEVLSRSPSTICTLDF